MKQPARAPHEYDIMLTIAVGFKSAIKRETATKTPHSDLIQITVVLSFTEGFITPFIRSIDIDEEDTRTSEDRVDIDAERSSTSMIPRSTEGSAAVIT